MGDAAASEGVCTLIVSIQDAAYAAGFFDGEGCICINYQNGNYTKRGKTYSIKRYHLSVSMSQNDPAPIKWLVERFGGSARFLRGKRSYDKGFYERWNWVISTAKAVEFLKIIRPFLIVKATQADLAFQFADTMLKEKPGRGKRTPTEIQAKRQMFSQQMKEIKRAVKVA